MWILYIADVLKGPALDDHGDIVINIASPAFN